MLGRKKRPVQLFGRCDEMSRELVQIPLNWTSLTPAEFESLVFFLLDDMGFKSLEWRKGGEEISATDGGRDLQATYAKVEPDDTLTIEKWWIEVKYRSQTLSPDVVQKVVLNTLGRREVDVLAIVTNNVISNPTLDWLREFQSSQPRPRIVVWQRHDLERVLRKYPGTVAKCFPGCLTLAGRLKAVEERFWNSGMLPTLDDIAAVWRSFSELDWSGSGLLPFVIAEASAGNPNVRQWGLIIDEKLLLETLVVGLSNVPPLVVRLHQYGRTSDHLVAGLSYLLQVALCRLDLDKLMALIGNPYKFMEGKNTPERGLVNFILLPILTWTYQDLGINCSQDCMKVSWTDRPKHRTDSYFERFVIREKSNEREGPWVIISLDEFDCTLGLVYKGEPCPLTDEICDDCGEEGNLRRVLGFAQQVIKLRAGKTPKHAA